MTHDEKLDRIRQEPEYRRIEVGGVEREFYLGRMALRLAKARGVDVLESAGEDGLDGVARMVWAGCLPFDGDLPDLDDFADTLSLRDLMRLAPLVNVTDGAAGDGPPVAGAVAVATEGAP